MITLKARATPPRHSKERSIDICFAKRKWKIRECKPTKTWRPSSRRLPLWMDLWNPKPGCLKGHTERDIVEGVIRVVVPGSALKTYLEDRAGLTLPNLCRVLCSHYQEKQSCTTSFLGWHRNLRSGSELVDETCKIAQEVLQKSSNGNKYCCNAGRDSIFPSTARFVPRNRSWS